MTQPVPTHAEPDPHELLTGVAAPEAVPVLAAEPLPVVPRPATSAQTWQYPLTAGVVADVAGAHPARRSLMVVNTGSSAALLGFSLNLSATNGFPLPAGAAITVEARGAVYALAAAAGAVLAFLAQYEDG